MVDIKPEYRWIMHEEETNSSKIDDKQQQTKSWANIGTI